MKPNHVAIIMDGNRRWATTNNKQHDAGHRVGAKSLMQLCKNFYRYNIKWLTVYAFSNENGRRSDIEKQRLFSMLEEYLDGDIKKLQEKQIKVQFIGDFSIFSIETQEKILNINNFIVHDSHYTLTVALNYGGRQEICYAASTTNGLLTEKEFQTRLYSNIPDVDLLIRTGGMQRISNFLLWQITYAELYFTQCLWPDFNHNEFQNALEFYSIQKRNFGA
ncbi:MAG: undecaprenyl diphosphate synthase [Candidatus Deianiraeaceae bacterium]|jgi:undecaprenyl diphosphate synthase